MTTQLLEPITSGIRNIHFFEGRLLTGRDLREQQTADRKHHRQIGRALGPGIVKGLEVTVENNGAAGDPPVVSVSQGLAVSADGHALEVETAYVHVKLARELEVPPAEGDLFADCAGPPTSAVLPNGTGIFLLCLSPATRFEDYAPKSGLDSGGVAAGCGRRYHSDGVTFRLVELDPFNMPDVSVPVQAKLKNDLLSAVNPAAVSEPKRISLLRNILAHICFGTDRILGAASDPFQSPADASAALEPVYAGMGDLSDCDVPLAMIYWTLDGIAFLDHWSVRRELQLCSDAQGLFAHPSSSLHEVMFRQLREHMHDLSKALITASTLAQLPVNDLFHYLPSVGTVPIVGGGSLSGFNLNTFFAGRSSGAPTVIRKQDALDLYAAARRFPPVVLSSNDILQLYWVRENLGAVNSNASTQRYVLFTSRDLHGFNEADKVTQVLGQTWKSYSVLLRKQVMLPTTLAGHAMPVWGALHTDQQNIIQFAMSREAAAGNRRLDRAAVLQMFNGLYQLQKGFAASLEMTFDEDNTLPVRTQFADQLGDMLDTSVPSGGAGLQVALKNDDFQSVLSAQQEINTFISSWSGEVIAGRIQLQHVGSPDGLTLIPGRDDPFVFEMLVTARTDKRARILLSAHMERFTSGNWGDAVRLVDAVTGNSIDAVDLNPDQERRVDVEVVAPNDAEVPQDVVMHVTAELPSPTNRSWIKAIALATGDNPTSPVNWNLALETLSLASNRDDATPGNTLEFILTSEYLAASAPQSTNCTLTATFEFENSNRANWGISVVGQPDAETEANSSVFQYSFSLPADGFGGRERIRIRINPPASRKTDDQICTFSVNIAADILDPDTGSTVKINDDLSDGLRVVLQGTS